MTLVEEGPTPSGAVTGRPPRRRRRRAGRWVLLVLAVLVVGLVVAGVLVVRDALAAREALTAAAAQVPAVEQALLEGDADAAGAGLADVQEQTTRARQATDGPLWWAAGHAPGVGADARAATTVSAALDDVAHDVLPALLAARAVVDQAAVGPDGTVDLTGLTEAAPALERASTSLDAARERTAAIDADALLPQLAAPLEDLRSRLDDLAPTVATADRVAALLPPLLGADGPRTYLLLALNNAELRASGGIPGALVLLRAEDGRVTVERQASAADVGPFDAPVLPLDPADAELYGDRLGRFVQDVTLTPDFPTSAALVARMWETAQGERVDGVLATDPVALSYLLGATGPVQVGDAEVSAEEAVPMLLSEAYAVLPAGETDAFFAAVAGQVFGRVTGALSDGGAAGLLAPLQQAAGEHRLLVWSAHPQEQARLADTVLSGSFDAADRAADAVGVFVNDGVAGKMTYYLDSSVTVVDSRCEAGTRTDTLEVRLTSRAPADAATSLPSYVAGLPGGAVPPGTIRANVVVAGPRDGALPRLSRDGAAFGGQTATDAGRQTVTFPQDLAPGQSATVRVDVPATPDGAASGSLDLWTTPTVRAGGLTTTEVPTCG